MALKPENHPGQVTRVQPVSRTAEVEEHRVKRLKSGGSVITERLYIYIKQDLKKKKKNFRITVIYVRFKLVPDLSHPYENGGKKSTYYCSVPETSPLVTGYWGVYVQLIKIGGQRVFVVKIGHLLKKKSLTDG